MSDISLSKAVRSNLLSLQSTAEMMGKTQERLSTGNKVNSALDNPTNFFTAASLNSRSNDLNALMDSMANGIQTLKAADNGLSSITKNLESMQSTLRQARQDKSFQTSSYAMGTVPTATVKNLAISGGAVTGTVNVALNTADVAAVASSRVSSGGSDLTTDFDLSALNGQTVTLTDGTNTSTYTFTNAATGQKAAMIAALGTSGFTATAAATGLNFGRADGKEVTITTSNGAVATALGSPSATVTSNGTEASTGVVKTVDELVTSINGNVGLTGKIRASNDNGKLRVENLSTGDLTVGGLSATNTITGGVTTANIAGNSVRADLAAQFNELRDQLDKISDDASFNGINLLRGDNLKITFNETGTSTIDVQTKGGVQLNSAKLNLFNLTTSQLDSDTSIDAQLATLKIALNDVRSQSSAFGSNLSIVQNRQDFTKAMINTLQTGAANLTLADMNEEAANLLALQTRQSLSSSSLSLASEADQSVLQLLR